MRSFFTVDRCIFATLALVLALAFFGNAVAIAHVLSLQVPVPAPSGCACGPCCPCKAPKAAQTEPRAEKSGGKCYVIDGNGRREISAEEFAREWGVVRPAPKK
jgi:hypothetical protein